MAKQQIGVIGLAVMGKNLALNIESRGFSVSVYNRSRERTDELVKEASGRNLIGTYSIQEFVDSLETPRKIIIMVKAGKPVDDTIEQLIPFLSKGDILIDGGNSYFMDTIRRNRELEQAGFRFIGTGISGGEEGALKGPAIMPGGQKDAYELVEPILTSISAKSERRALLYLYRYRWSRALRKDGAQRYRIWRHAAYMRGLFSPQEHTRPVGGRAA
jgi:6-phosphogluconate dehydrogenase